MAKDLDAWMAMWDLSYVVTFPCATQPPIAPITGWENLREITRQKFIDRLHIDLGAGTDPLQTQVHLDVDHTLADGTVRKLPLLHLYTFNSGVRIVALEEYFNQATLP